MERRFAPAFCISHHRYDDIYGTIYHCGHDFCSAVCQYRCAFFNQYCVSDYQCDGGTGNNDCNRRKRHCLSQNGSRWKSRGKRRFYAAHYHRSSDWFCHSHNWDNLDWQNHLCSWCQWSALPLLQRLSLDAASIHSGKCFANAVFKPIRNSRKTRAWLWPICSGWRGEYHFRLCFYWGMRLGYSRSCLGNRIRLSDSHRGRACVLRTE